eukprot:snap_masked-scaffold_3-processed-gene-8.26-mRNA-1 protein AED:1.00 eAED:1.00 QI:0/-1/0/0/-1/1/1/0/554
MIFIFYASETGTAKEFAERISSIATWKHNIKSRTLNLARFTTFENYVDLITECANNSTETIFIFVASTFNIGLPPDECIPARDFFKQISPEFFLTLETVLTGKISYAVLGLGDSCYSDFAAFGHFLNNTFETIDNNGGRKIMDITTLDADEQDHVREDKFINWRNHLFSSLKHMDLEKDPQVNLHPYIRPDYSKYILTELFQPKESYFAPCKIMNIRKLNPGTVEAEIQFPMDIEYSPADTLHLLPENSKENVTSFKDLFNLARDTFLQVENIVTTAVDLNARPNQDFIEKIGFYFGFDEEISDEDVTVLQVLFHISNKDLSFEKLLFLLSLLPRIKPREYTIASSPLEGNSNQVKLCIALVGDVNPKNIGKKAADRVPVVPGLASTFLLSNPKRCLCKITSALFSKYVPVVNEKPLLLISNGTGIAMTRSFLQHRTLQPSSDNMLNPVIVFSGFRDSKNILYESDITSNDHTNLQVFNALSRETYKRVYVQRKLMAEKKEVKKFLLQKEEPLVLVCGSSQMVFGVTKALERIIGKGSLSKLKKDERLVIESFG